MNNGWGLVFYLITGLIGGAIGFRLKIPGGTIIGAMLAVIILNLLGGRSWELPSSYKFTVEVLIGIMVGASFSKEIGQKLIPLIIPVLGSTLILVVTGVLVSLLLEKFGILDRTTAYVSTSPGAMSALLGLAGDTGANLPVVLCFHVFRIIFIIVTAPFIFRLLQNWLGPPT